MISAGDFLLGVAGLQAGLIRPDEFAGVVREWESGGGEATFTELLAASLQESAVAALRDHAFRLADLAETDLPGAAAELRRVMQSLGLNSQELPTLQPQGAFLDVPDTGLSVAEEAPGRYQFSVEHAQGGMGKIYVVYDRFLARRIALKELLPLAPVSSSASTVQVKGPGPEPLARQRRARFLYEARITGQLEHPSIVPVYELGTREDGTLYYTMRLVKGKSLRQAIRAAGTLEGRLRHLSHFISLCQAIAFAHSRGVIHRDIKPGNVMVGEYGETIVIDWGLARMRPTGDATTDTSAGDVEIDLIKEAEADVVAIGTPAYMPPEQARGEVSAIDERSDVYSLGAVLYELLSGSAPYSDPTPASALNKLLTEPPAPLESLCADVPEELAAICRRAMEREPAARYQSARELAADIEHFQAGRLVGAYRYSPTELFSHFVRRFKAPIAVGALGLASLAVMGSVAYIQVQEERNRAIQESVRALEAERVAEDARAAAEQEFYLAAIASSRQLIRDSQFERAAILLDKCADRYRHWEWGYLMYLCNRDQRSYLAHTPETAWSLDMAPAKGLAISAGFDSTARGWSLETGTADFVYRSPNGAVIEAAAHPTRPLVACAEEKGFVTLYDYDALAVLASWRVNQDGDVNCVQFSPDGTRLVTGDDQGYIRVWEVGTRAPLLEIAPVNRGIEALAYSPDGTLIAAANRSEVVTVFDAQTGAPRWTLSGHTGRVTSLAFSPDGALLASGSRDQSAILWSMEDGSPRQQLTGHGAAIWCLDFSPDGTWLATGSSDLSIRLWETSTWTVARTYRGHLRQIYCLSFSPDGRRLFSADDLGQMKEWDVSTGLNLEDRWTLRGHTGPINNLDYSPDGALLVTAAGFWETHDDTTARLWHAEHGTPAGVLTGHTGAVRHAIFHPRGEVVATSSMDGTVRLWEPGTGREIRALGPFEGGVNVSEFNPVNPDQLLIGTRSGHLALADWRSGAILAQWLEHDGEVLSLSFSPNGQWFASASGDDTVHVLSAESREQLAVLQHNEARIPAVAFSPDGHWLATGGHDWRIKLWRPGSWELAHELTGHTQGLYGLAFSPDSRRLLSSASDGISILWDLVNFREVIQIDGWVGAFRPDSEDIATGMTNGDTYVYPALSWKKGAYPGPAEQPLLQRAEALKRSFWERRLPAPQGLSEVAAAGENQVP